MMDTQDSVHALFCAVVANADNTMPDARYQASIKHRFMLAQATWCEVFENYLKRKKKVLESTNLSDDESGLVDPFDKEAVVKAWEVLSGDLSDYWSLEQFDDTNHRVRDRCALLNEVEAFMSKTLMESEVEQ